MPTIQSKRFSSRARSRIRRGGEQLRDYQRRTTRFLKRHKTTIFFHVTTAIVVLYLTHLVDANDSDLLGDFRTG